jgi:hypothetical protein
MSALHMRLLKIASSVSCPVSTQDSELNFRNKSIAVAEASYGPIDQNDASYWNKLAEVLGVNEADVKKNLCGNCGVWDRTSHMLGCIERGLSAENTSELGYCRIYQFCCSEKRTCLDWVPDGPILD